MDQSLFQQAIKIQNSTAIDIKKNEKDYAFTFIYPPSQVLYPLREGIFDNKEIKEANLYIHIPYCTGRCTYCYFGCYPLEKAPISREDYVNTMVKEIELVSSKYGKVRISSVHFGGGTPTTLSNAQFDSIFNAIRKNFDVADKLEITVESSPETLTEEKLECLVKNGVNRLNIVFFPILLRSTLFPPDCADCTEKTVLHFPPRFSSQNPENRCDNGCLLPDKDCCSLLFCHCPE